VAEPAEDLERRITALEIRNAVDDVHRANVSDRLGAIEDTLKWLMRLIIGGLLIGGLTYALQGGFVT
jgi:hypothetical protein